MMAEPILCLVIAFFVGWIVYLKTRMANLQEQIDELARQMQNHVRESAKKAENDAGRTSGQKTSWFK